MVDSLPNNIIPLIVGALTYESLVDIFKKINRNISSIQMNLGGGGDLGYLAWTVTTALYATLSSSAFNSPSNTKAAP